MGTIVYHVKSISRLSVICIVHTLVYNLNMESAQKLKILGRSHNRRILYTSYEGQGIKVTRSNNGQVLTIQWLHN